MISNAIVWQILYASLRKMKCLLQLSLLVALAAVIAVDAGVLPVEEKFVPTGIIIIMVSVC